MKGVETFMSYYLDKINAVQTGVDNFYRLLNFYKLSRLGNGWVGSENEFNNTNLSKFQSYLTDNNYVSPAEGTTATLFDIPMLSRGYDKDGKYGYGIPSDIGFTNNVEMTN